MAAPHHPRAPAGQLRLLPRPAARRRLWRDQPAAAGPPAPPRGPGAGADPRRRPSCRCGHRLPLRGGWPRGPRGAVSRAGRGSCHGRVCQPEGHPPLPAGRRATAAGPSGPRARCPGAGHPAGHGRAAHGEVQLRLDRTATRPRTCSRPYRAARRHPAAAARPRGAVRRLLRAGAHRRVLRDRQPLPGAEPPAPRRHRAGALRGGWVGDQPGAARAVAAALRTGPRTVPGRPTVPARHQGRGARTGLVRARLLAARPRRGGAALVQLGGQPRRGDRAPLQPRRRAILRGDHPPAARRRRGDHGVRPPGPGDLHPLRLRLLRQLGPDPGRLVHRRHRGRRPDPLRPAPAPGPGRAGPPAVLPVAAGGDPALGRAERRGGRGAGIGARGGGRPRRPLVAAGAVPDRRPAPPGRGSRGSAAPGDQPRRGAGQRGASAAGHRRPAAAACGQNGR